MRSTRRKNPVYRGLFLAMACFLTLILLPRASYAASTTAQPIVLHFSSTVLKGPDTGVQLDGILTLTPGMGTQISGTLSTFGGILMGELGSYTPIAAAGTVNGTHVDVTFNLGAAAQAGSMGSMVSAALFKRAMPQFAHLGASAALHGTGQAVPGGWFAGTFSGPASADSGYWTAVPVAAHTFDISAKATTGSKWSLSGQAAVAIGADGDVTGLYVGDDGKTIYPLHGVIGNKWMSLVLALGNNQFLYGNGTADNIDVYQFFTGTFYGPTAATSGKWSANFTS